MHRIFVGGKMTLKIILLLIALLRPAAPVPIQQYIIVEMEVTAYCSCEICCGNHSDGITASGYKIRPGDKLVAAPRTFQFGTKIFVPEYGLASVKDRGGAIYDNRLDVYFSTHEEALEWGRRKCTCLIYKQ